MNLEFKAERRAEFGDPCGSSIDRSAGWVVGVGKGGEATVWDGVGWEDLGLEGTGFLECKVLGL